MAEVRKKEKVEKYNIDEIAVKKNKKDEAKKKSTRDKKSKVITKKNVSERRNLWIRFRVFCHGVKSEFLKIHWLSKKDMFRYSVASIFFMIFCALFFYLINIIFALVQMLFN